MRIIDVSNHNIVYGAKMLQILSLLSAQGITGLDIFNFLIKQTTMQGLNYTMKSDKRSDLEQYTINIGNESIIISGAIRNNLTAYSQVSQKWTNEDAIDYQDLTIKLLGFSVTALTYKHPIFVGVNYNDDALVGTGPGEIVYSGPRRGVHLVLYCLDLPGDDIIKVVNADLEIHPISEFAILHKDVL